MEEVSAEKRDTAVWGREQVSERPDPPMWWRRQEQSRIMPCGGDVTSLPKDVQRRSV